MSPLILLLNWMSYSQEKYRNKKVQEFKWRQLYSNNNLKKIKLYWCTLKKKKILALAFSPSLGSLSLALFTFVHSFSFKCVFVILVFCGPQPHISNTNITPLLRDLTYIQRQTHHQSSKLIPFLLCSIPVAGTIICLVVQSRHYPELLFPLLITVIKFYHFYWSNTYCINMFLSISTGISFS